MVSKSLQGLSIPSRDGKKQKEKEYQVELLSLVHFPLYNEHDAYGTYLPLPVSCPG